MLGIEVYVARQLASFRLIALVLLAVLGIAACSNGDPATQLPARQAGQPAEPAQLTSQPANGAQDFSPAAPAQVTVADGTLDTVTLTNAEGKQVKGNLAPDRRGWSTAEPLGYGKTYTWGGSATGADGKPVPITGSFRTVSPVRQVEGRLNVGDNLTYGIAMPISLTFPGKVADKASVEKALTVQTTPNTEGSWAWVENDTSVHWRPRQYWQPGTKVTVTAKLYGVTFGDGAYGNDDVSAHFTIGRAQIVKGNTQTHRMQVIRDGQQIGDYPVSYGLDTDPGRVTHSGIHVVAEKHPTFSMTNPRYNYTDVNVPWAVRISNNGEFIHGLASSMYAQGNSNVSHGCINMSPANAKEYYDGALIGDPVEIEGSTLQLGAKDGDYADWTYSWDAWKALSALQGSRQPTGSITTT